MLVARSEPALLGAHIRRCLCGGANAREFREFEYQTRHRWSRARRVIGKAEVTGQGSIPGGLSNVTTICAGPTNSLALKSDDTVAAWGNVNNWQTDIPEGLTNVQTVFAGSVNAFAGLTDGSLVQWGTGPVWQHNGTHTQLLVGTGLSNVGAVAAGEFSGWSLQADGARFWLGFNSIPVWSNNGFGWQSDQLSGHGNILILASTNLADWVPILTNPAVTGLREFFQPGATNQAGCFNRAIEQKVGVQRQGKDPPVANHLTAAAGAGSRPTSDAPRVSSPFPAPRPVTPRRPTIRISAFC